jgi:hypothetical protein
VPSLMDLARRDDQIFRHEKDYAVDLAPEGFLIRPSSGYTIGVDAFDVVGTLEPTPTPSKPAIVGVSPSSGAAAGGSEVTITGANPAGTVSVTFGGAAAARFTIDKGTQITATTPGHVGGTADAVVTTAGGVCCR